jgi:YD repeat-containing protein
VKDLNRWDLRGPVRACRLHRTWFTRRCGADACETEESGDATDLEFNENRTLSRHSHTNPDGSHWTVNYSYDYQSNHLVAVRQTREDGVAVCTSEYDKEGRLLRVISRDVDSDRTTEEYEYDHQGRKKKTQYVDIRTQQPDTNCFYGVEGTDTFYSASGTAELTTLYNDRDQPVELRFYDAADKVLNRIAFTYDGDGNLIEELQTSASDTFENLFSEAPPDQVDALRVMYQSATEPMRVTHRYDHQGRRVETRRRLGLIGHQIRIRAYNEHGDEVAENDEGQFRTYGLDEEGQILPVPGSEGTSRSEARFHYEYDAHGNWITKRVESRSSAEQDFSLSAVEKRTIEYFE